jgi:nuclear transport factor 2 (NTF2) superfamily protein
MLNLCLILIMHEINNNEHLLRKIYDEFNARHIDKVLSAFHKDVEWPNGWEGGYVHGHEEIRDYWTRQWKEIDPVVTPTAVKQNNEAIEVTVHQLVKDKNGTVLMDKTIKHVYFFEDGLVKRMEIEE